MHLGTYALCLCMYMCTLVGVCAELRQVHFATTVCWLGTLHIGFRASANHSNSVYIND